MGKLMIVEDEMPISQVLKAYLKKANYETVHVYRGDEVLERFHQESPSLVILDVMLPGKNGWDVLKEIRKISDCPVIMLTALSEVGNRLSGLNQGADDYIAKPFVGDEVVARVKAVLRRAGKETPAVKRFGSLHVDLIGHRIKVDGEEITLTPRDLSLLTFFAEHPNQTFTRDQLIERVWGWEYEGSDRAVDVSIKRIRNSLRDWPASQGEIRTLRGLGYQLSVYQ
ncbi:response regulator transcription factor [Jeotgalibacillus sp. S-D1]|uniref:response regulator transcription factor n=1 Tax=Jeotgalibacillus sp. S-D1 TaxID=2552189 RepID=UPI0010598AA6|nr:response regulator transcription factor [Jeotgalibacillus sp. S-D1]TDL30671.1 response regulator transcription factor [Jeotgalibacillus sp. S-D1]